MFRRVEDFLEAYETQAGATRKIFGALTDDALSQAVAAGHRTLGGMAWHIVTSVPEMMSRTGLGLPGVDPESNPPTTAAEIVAGYETVSSELVEAIRGNWEDAALLEEDEMYGQQWCRGLTLAILLNHEIHHRGQMTVLLRQAGARVPGVFGPAQEEWDQYGMPAPAY